MNHAPSISTPGPFPCRFEAESDPAPTADGVDDDAALFLRAVAGDEQAWQQVFDRWKRPLLAFFYRSLGAMPEAEDLTLEVFVRLHRTGPRYRPSAAFSSFVFHIARNLLLNEQRRRRRKPAEPQPPEAFEYLAAAGSDQSQRLAEWEESLQHALAQLPEARRTPLLLIHQQGLAPSRVATMLGLTENALRVQLHRTRQRLKELMSIRR